MKRVNIVSFADDNLASFRLRQKVIAEWINKHSDSWRVNISDRPDLTADINLFHKHFNKDMVLAWAREIRHNHADKTKIMFDISDFWFDSPLKSFYEEMLVLSDFCTVSSFNLMQFVEKKNTCSRGLIFEPTQLEFVKPSKKVKRRAGSYVWFGHPSNFKDILPHIDKYKKDLTLISSENPVKETHPEVKFIKWHPGVEARLFEFETALLPQSDYYKSPNRLVDAYMAGCKVETFGAACYAPFLCPGGPDEFKKLASHLFKLETVAKDWLSLFDLVVSSPSKLTESTKGVPLHPAVASKKYVKLNLGCGFKIYPKKEGWVNIDLTNNPDLDIVADVRNITSVVGSCVADEIHAYHVIEHFYPQELLGILKNWYDTLKPGGMLCLEQPCFLKAAKNILQLETTNQPALWFDLGLKAFYGEYDSTSPTVNLDLHKWAWTFRTLSTELQKIGFVDIKEEKPVTHRLERDFRLVARKPQ